MPLRGDGCIWVGGKAFFFQVEYVTDMVIKMGSNRNENEGENI